MDFKEKLKVEATNLDGSIETLNNYIIKDNNGYSNLLSIILA